MIKGTSNYIQTIRNEILMTSNTFNLSLYWTQATCVLFLKYLKEETGNFGKIIDFTLEKIGNWIQICFPYVDSIALAKFVYDKLKTLTDPEKLAKAISECDVSAEQCYEMIISHYSEIGQFLGDDHSELSSPLLEKIISIILLSYKREENKKYSFADFSNSSINIVKEIYKLDRDNQYSKYISNRDICYLLRILNLLLKREIDIKNANPLIEKIDEKYDFLSIVDPISLRYKSGELERIQNIYSEEYSIFSRNMTWVNAIPALNNLTPNGVSALVLSEASGFESDVHSLRVRRYLIENKKLKAIYSLPAKLFRQTNVRCVLYLLGNNEGNIKLVDLEKYITNDLNFSRNEERDYLILKDRIDEAEKKSVYVEKFDDNFSFNVAKYMYKKEYGCGVEKLGNLLRRYYRGIQITNTELQKQTDGIENSNLRLLTNADIEDCLINSSAKKIGRIDIKQEKFVVSDPGILVLSKMGPNFKVGITECDAGEKYLVTSNLYVLEVDEKKINPFYLLYFLNSDVGKELLKNNSAGSTIPTLNNDDIENLEIPVPEKKIQDEISERMEISVRHIRSAKLAYEIVKEQLNIMNSYSEEMVNGDFERVYRAMANKEMKNQEQNC